MTSHVRHLREAPPSRQMRQDHTYSASVAIGMPSTVIHNGAADILDAVSVTAVPAEQVGRAPSDWEKESQTGAQ
ncbi:hypothetical protein SprV_0602231100 [Sparganum proliferum]